MSHTQSEQKPVTKVYVENLVFGISAVFTSTLTPQRVSEWAMLLFQYEEGDEFPPPKRIQDDWCDYEPVGMAVAIWPDFVVLCYHATGDLAAAKQWFMEHEHLRDDGTIGVYVSEKERRAV